MTAVSLNEDQQRLRGEIEKCLDILRDEEQSEGLSTTERNHLFKEMAEKAHVLHMQLDPRPKHHKYMIKNRGMSPDHPNFYFHIHPVEDFLAYLDDQNANNDPSDQTIGETFVLKIYSRRWGHNDLYKLTRISSGWEIKTMNRGGSCDKQGKPFLYQVLNNESISYPHDLPGFLEWLWDQAAEMGLSKEEIQTSLNDIAEWINVCEINTPKGIFRGYK
jgi:hypothetical protein